MEARATEPSKGIFDYTLTIAILHDEQGHRRLFEGFLRECEVEGIA